MKTFFKMSALWGLFLSQLLLAPAAFSQEPTRTAPPDWVKVQPVPLEKAIDPAALVGGFHYILADYQTNIPTQQVYRHNVFKVVSSDGVQNMSDIELEYDPSYQTLQFHLVRLHRDGRIIDNLANHEIKTFQRESGMDRHLYNGSLTAVINQENVQIGDIIEYSYTRTGFNPIHGNDFFYGFYQKVSFPIQRLRFLLIADAKQPIYFNYLNDAVPPTTTDNGSLVEYNWIFDDIPAHLFEDNTPDWFDPLPFVGVSSYDNWSQVADWALPHYQVEPADAASLKNLAPELTPATDLEDQIIQAIRFVQDEVRYLGMEQGLGAYRPNQPFGVYQRRFGDCKDKSLLLVTLLNNLGLEAHPVQVHTVQESRVSQKIPSPGAFNHCIVRFTHDGQDIFVDPTMSGQGGDLDHLEGLPYGSGLVIANGVTDLVDLPTPSPETIDIAYTITVEKVGGPAQLAVRTTYAGRGANSRRDWFINTSIDEISRNSLDYYSEAYQGLTQVHPARVIDEERDGGNVLIVEESFRTEDFWTTSEVDSNAVFAEMVPLEMTEVADVPPSAERASPYYLGPLLDLSLTIKIVMPEDWPVKSDKVEIKSDAFAYNSEMKGRGNTIEMSYRYRRLKESIPPEDTLDFLKDHDRVWNDLTLYITHDPCKEEFSFSWFAGALAALTFLVTVLASRRISREYDPALTVTQESARSIRGWLILPAIGFFTGPFYMAFDLISDTTYFNHNTWVSVLQETDYASFSGFGVVLVYELIGNTFFLVFSLLILVQFLRKRSSLPRLVVIYLSSTFIFIGLDFIGANFLIDTHLLPDIQPEEIRNMASALFSVLIWVPYFLKSSRVRQTFINRALSPASVAPIVDATPVGLAATAATDALEEPPAPATILPPAPVRIVRWPAVMIITIIFQTIGVVVGLVSGISSFQDFPSVDSSPSSPYMVGQKIGAVLGPLIVITLPLIGLLSLVKRRTWARTYNGVLFTILSLGILLGAIFTYKPDSDPDANASLIGLIIVSVPLILLALALHRTKAAKTFPGAILAKGPVEISDTADSGMQPEASRDYADHCRQHTLALFQRIQTDFPDFEMTILDHDPNAPAAMVIPVQSRITRRIFLDLQKTSVLNLSIGPVWLTWQPCDQEHIRDDYFATVCALLAGTYRFVEYRRGAEVVKAEIQRPHNQGWVKVRQWSIARWTSSRGLEKEVIILGRSASP